MVTILSESGRQEVGASRADGDDLWIASSDVEQAIDWTLKPEGLCQGSVCIPTPSTDRERYVNGEQVNLSAWWQLMNRPVVHDAAGENWVFGAGAEQRAASLDSLDAPDFALPDLDGKMHSLSDYRGKRTFLLTWSSW